MIIYSDMDGVLADFFGALAQEYFVDHWKEIEDIDGVLEELSGTSFFSRLPIFHKVTYQLVGHLKEIESTNKFIQWGIISTPLKCDHEHSIRQKTKWLVEKNLMPSKHNLHFLYDKEQLATNRLDGSPNVLIDDKPTNIKKWNDAGGIGLQFQAGKDILGTLLKRINEVIA
tara:strand:- start:394 stop:906 length:513 start_codon:yes stop_codon:yes gene_type:complete